VKSKGKPDAGNPPVRFDEGEGFPSLLYWQKLSVLRVSSEAGGEEKQVEGCRREVFRTV
jgi:hypothetical protein